MRIRTNSDSVKGISFSKDSFHDLVILFANQTVVMVACIDVLYDPSTITMLVSNFVDLSLPYQRKQQNGDLVVPVPFVRLVKSLDCNGWTS
jgi:hypothetical protein